MKWKEQVTLQYWNLVLLLPEVGSNELHLLRYIYLSKFLKEMYFLSTFFARYFLLLLEYIYEEETVLLLRYICKIRLVTLKKNSLTH